MVARCELVHEESNAYLHSRFGRLERFDAVDVDPFGTPAPYVQGALTAADDGAVVSMTATDTATLCGVYPVGRVQEVWRPRREERVRPRGRGTRPAGVLRADRAASSTRASSRLLAHSTLHYLRVYFRVARGAAKSDRCLRELGYVSSCGVCHEDVGDVGLQPDVPELREQGEVHRAAVGGEAGRRGGSL